MEEDYDQEEIVETHIRNSSNQKGKLYSSWLN